MTSEAILSSATTDPSAPASSWARFPYPQIAGNGILEGVFARLVWLAVPLEYYVLIQFAGGIPIYGFITTALVALLTLLLVLSLSLVLARIPLPRELPFEDRVRRLTVSLVINWAGSLLLLALGYFIDNRIGLTDDIVAHVVKIKFDFFQNYPQILDPTTFIVYVIYALMAAFLIRLIVGFFKYDKKVSLPDGPNIFVLAALTAIVMMLIHGATKLT